MSVKVEKTEKKNEVNEEDKEKNYIRRERSYGKYERSFYLGDLDEDKFNESIEEYNKNLQKEQAKETFNKVIEFFKENFIYMISAIAIVAAIIIVIYIKKNRSALD